MNSIFFKISKIYNSNILKKKIFYLFILIISFNFIYIFSFNKKNNLLIFKYYVQECQNFKPYNTKKVFNKVEPYLSICIPAYNIEKYIEKCLISILNQTFKKFEIILTNDNSKDDTSNIIKLYQDEDKRIRIINHYKNLGVYSSRIDASLNSIGKYILFVDPDDMLLNPYLFEELYNYNLKYNLDMLEFTVYHKNEEREKIYFPQYHEFTHYHNFKRKFIYQPELSDLIFYSPNTNNYSPIICRTIWNKIVRRRILINSINYIEQSFHKIYLITADDTPINMLNFHYSNNYSNLNLPGYLYNIRKKSMSRLNNNGDNHDLIVSYNYLLYFALFYKYIKDFKKDMNYLFYDLKINYYYILKIKEMKEIQYILNSFNITNQILKNNISSSFEHFNKNLMISLINDYKKI